MGPSTEHPIVILGAGLAGLSLAVALGEVGIACPIVLIDRRRDWERDRTWCTWRTPELRFAECASHVWSRWELTAGPRTARASSTRHPYIHLDGADVYAAALDRLASRSNVEIRLEEGVRSVQAGRVPVVHTSRGQLEASLVFDAMGPNSPLAGTRPSGAGVLTQRFTGWEVEVAHPVFDPGVATLMDFRPHAGAGVTFMYVLPFSPTRALLEHTSIEPPSAARVDRDAALEGELRERWRVSDWRILRRERGQIPMSTAPYPAAHGLGVHTVGAASGAIRPSSGYAFSRIQRQVGAISAAIADQAPLPRTVTHVRHTMLDRVFIRALSLSDHPAGLFLATAAVPGDAFARFMTDTSSPADEARVIASLPVAEMTRAAVGAALGPLGRRDSG